MKNEIGSWTVLRAVAAIWVVIYHFKKHFNPELSIHLVEKGYLAVDVFFILSGAVMYHVYSDSIINGRFQITQFLLKRFARIYPVHFVTMIASVVVLLGGSALGLAALPPYDLTSALIYNTLLLHGQGALDQLTLNYPSWSISAEATAYVVFFPLCLFAFKIPPRLSFVTGGVFFLMCSALFQILQPTTWLVDNHRISLTEITYEFSMFRILPEFILGMLVVRTARFYRSCKIGTGWLIFSMACMFVFVYTNIDSGFVIFAAAMIGLLYLIDAQPHRFATYLGTISYSIYMVHALVEMVGFKILERVGGWPNDEVPIWTLPIMLAATIVLGSLAYHFIEKPGRHFVLFVSTGRFSRRYR